MLCTWFAAKLYLVVMYRVGHVESNFYEVHPFRRSVNVESQLHASVT